MTEDSLRHIQQTCLDDSLDWFPHVTKDIKHQTLALCGEAGELANLVKKADRGTLDYDKFLELAPGEVIDVLIYVCNVANCLKIDLVKEYNDKRRYNGQRFGHGKESA